MPKLSEKTKLMREAAREAAEQMAAEGDRTILDTAEVLAAEIKWLSVDGALEVLMCAGLRELENNGQAAEVASVERALNRYNQETRDG
jgi:hypothetical protein